MRRISGCPNSLAPSVFLLLVHIKRARRRRRRRRKTSVKELYARKRLPIRGRK
jgi:hypothetical protein